MILRIALGVGTARQAADRLAAVCFWFLWLVETERRDHQLDDYEKSGSLVPEPPPAISASAHLSPPCGLALALLISRWIDLEIYTFWTAGANTSVTFNVPAASSININHR